MRGPGCIEALHANPTGAPSNQQSGRLIQPIQNQICDPITVAFHHYHVPIAMDAAIGQPDELRRGALCGQPGGNVFVGLTRMLEICIAGHDDYGLSAEAGWIPHSHLGPTHI